MATTSTQTKIAAVPGFEAVAEQARDANERFLDAGRKVTSAYLDGIEKYMTEVAQFERKVGETSHVDAVGTLIDAHVKVTEAVVKASIAATRKLVTA